MNGSYRHYFFLSASAFSLHLALYVPAFFFWLSFFWLTPLFYLVYENRQRLSFVDGFFWGFIFFLFHLSEVVHLIMTQAHGVGRFLFPVLLINYCALHAGLWFLCAHRTASLFGGGQRVRMIAWSFWTYCYIFFLPYGLLWISGKWIGYPLSFPLVPLACYPPLLWLLGVVGRWVLMLFLIAFSVCFTFFLYERNRRYCILAALCSMPFLSGFLLQKQTDSLPDFVKKIGYIRPPDEKMFMHPLDNAQEIYYRMQSLLKKQPHLTSLVMPELSCHFALNEQEHLMRLWNNNALHDEVQLFIGASRTAENFLFNSLYLIKEGRVQQYYDKQNLMPLVEYVPQWCTKIVWLKNLFLCNNSFCEPSKPQHFFIFAKNVRCRPCICSDILFDKSSFYANVSYNATFILLTLNDSILMQKNLHFLMFLWTIFKAQELNTPFLYVGYHGAQWITKEGTIHTIAQ